MPQTGHQREVTSLTFAPDGRTLATSGAEGTVKLWDVSARKLLRTLEIGGRGAQSLSWSPDGSRFAGCGELGTIFLWSRDGELVRQWRPEDGQAYAVALMDGGKAVVAGRDFVTLVDPGTLKSAWRVSLDWSEVTDVTVSAGNRNLALVGSTLGGGGASSTNVALLDPATGAPLHRLSLPDTRPFSTRFSPTGKLLAVSGFDNRTERGAVWLLDTASGRLVRDIHPGITDVPSIAFSPDGQRLVIGGDVGGPGAECGSVQCWSLRSGLRLVERKTPGFSSVRVAVSPASGAIAVAEETFEDTPIRFLHSKTLRVIAGLPHLRSHVGLHDPSPDGPCLAFSGASEELLLWDRDTGTLQQAAPPAERTVREAGWTADGSLLAISGFPDGSALVDPHSGRKLVRLAEGRGFVGGFHFSRDGNRVIGSQMTAFEQLRFLEDTLLWDARSGGLVRRLQLTEGLRFSPSGKLLVGFALREEGEELNWPLRDMVKHYARTLTVWDATSGMLVRELGEAEEFRFVGASERVLRKDSSGFAVCDPRDGTITRMGPPADRFALSADGERLVIASSFQPVRLLDTRSGRYLQTRPAPNAFLRSIDLAPDGKTAAFGTSEAGVVLLNLESGETQVAGGGEPTEEIRSVQFSPDCRTVLGRSRDGARLWDVRGGGLLLSAPSQLPCDFAPDGNSLLLETLDGTLRVYDAHSGKERVTLASFPKSAGSPQRVWLAYTPDGRYVGSGGAERFIAWRVQQRIVAGSMLRAYRTPDLLKYAPWSFGQRQEQVEEAEARFRALPLWTLIAPNDEEARAELLRGLEELSQYDTQVLREVQRRASALGLADLTGTVGHAFNGMILNRYLFNVPATNSMRPQDHPLWPLYHDTQGRWRLDHFAGLGAGTGDPLAEFDAFRRRYPRRLPASGP